MAAEFSKRDARHPKALVVEGIDLWVSPEVLAGQSAFFHNLFYNTEYTDAAREKVILPGKALKTFIPFLRGMNRAPRGLCADEDGFTGFVEHAVEYAMLGVVSEAREEIWRVAQETDIGVQRGRDMLFRCLGNAYVVEGRRDTPYFIKIFKKITAISADLQCLTVARNIISNDLAVDILRMKMRLMVSRRVLFVFGPCGGCGKTQDPIVNDSCVCELDAFTFTDNDAVAAAAAAAAAANVAG